MLSFEYEPALYRPFELILVPLDVVGLISQSESECEVRQRHLLLYRFPADRALRKLTFLGSFSLLEIVSA